MKTVKTMMLGLIIAFTFGSIKAATVKNDDDNAKISVNFAITTYVNAIAHGQIANLDAVIDRNAKFSMLRGSKMMSYGKADLLSSLKVTENVNQECTTKTSISESNADISIVKVDMHYNGFTRTNYVTLANTVEGWKITDIYTVIKND